MKIYRFNRFNESTSSNKIDDVLMAIQLFNDTILELLDKGYYYYFKFDTVNGKRVVIDIDNKKQEQIFNYDDIEFLSKNLDLAYDMHDYKKSDIEIGYINFYLVSTIEVPKILKRIDYDVFYKHSFTFKQVKDKLEILNKFDNTITELDEEIKYYMSRIPYSIESILYNDKTPAEGGLVTKVMVEIKIKL